MNTRRWAARHANCRKSHAAVIAKVPVLCMCCVLAACQGSGQLGTSVGFTDLSIGLLLALLSLSPCGVAKRVAGCLNFLMVNSFLAVALSSYREAVTGPCSNGQTPFGGVRRASFAVQRRRLGTSRHR
jgi:hypothetical protein